MQYPSLIISLAEVTGRSTFVIYSLVKIAFFGSLDVVQVAPYALTDGNEF